MSNVIPFRKDTMTESARTVSRAAATAITEAVNGMLRDLERRGIDRGATGAAMIGMGAGIVAERYGAETLFRILDDSRLTVEGDKAPRN